MTSCSSTPSEGDARSIISGQIQKESKGLIKLVSFQKTNGQQGELFGVKVYQLSYQGEIEFLDNCKWERGMAVGLGEVHYRAIKMSSKSGPKASMQDWDDQLQGRLFMKKGQKQKIAGNIVFEKTERGWMLASL